MLKGEGKLSYILPIRTPSLGYLRAHVVIASIHALIWKADVDASMKPAIPCLACPSHAQMGALREDVMHAQGADWRSWKEARAERDRATPATSCEALHFS